MNNKTKLTGTNTKYNITVLQADVAYFDARLTLIRPKPKTNLEVAQKKVFQLLEKVFSKHLEIIMQRKKDYVKSIKAQRKK